MSLSPEIEIFEVYKNEQNETSETFRFDFETNRITSEIISGKEAVEQFIYLTLRTRRFVHPVYSADTGEEVHELMADKEVTTSYKKAEIPRLIEDALIYDDRIERVYGFEVTDEEDKIFVNFQVDTVEGSLSIQEVY
ncbi:DUF2634 domain-containing protein [Sporosarcina sp. resist]|uniref:DUF2634 domain-containing protein n=1 Tax=Sporosarcina sp. resist TaxID=2762563 RepID=UPI00164DF900|nr:DUF2634 domain-containing protein [Sporosarcina sp. resist]QNK87741.1 DUF2634 domain-containing protein [Sporosarcina sp. resist]